MRRKAALLPWVGTLALFAAGAVKLLDVPAFIDALTTWRGIPIRVIAPLAFAIPVVEIGLCFWWMTGSRRRLAATAMILLLAMFSVVYGAHALLLETPECGCFGKVAAVDRVRGSAVWALGRNALLAGTLLPAVFPAYHGPHARVNQAQTPEHSSPVRAFTLVETLVVLAILAVVIAIIVPTLSTARERGERLSNLASLRSHAQVFNAYAVDHTGEWPLFIRPTDEETTVSSSGVELGLHYFDMHSSWNVALSESYYGAPYNSPMFFPQGFEDRSARPDQIFTPFNYSCAMIADPAYWNRETRLDGRSQWRGTRVDHVLFPSAKSLLVNRWPGHDARLRRERRGALYELAFVDASAMVIPNAEIRSGYFRGDGERSYTQSGHMGDAPPALHTIDGVRGRDVDR